MAKKNGNSAGLDQLKNDLKSGQFKRVYAFLGEEQYLLETYLVQIREKLVPEGMEMFNHRRISGRNLDIAELSEAVEAYPAFCEYTLTEVEDADFSSLKEDEKQALLRVLSDVPEYAVVIFRFDAVELKLDGRTKTDAAIKKLMTLVEFEVQQSGALTKWIIKHVRENGHDISPSDAEYFAFYTGGLMANLNSEINKVCASCSNTFVTREDIERMVEPELNAAAFNMTDCILRGDYSGAVKILTQLYDMRTEPRMIIAVTATIIKQLYYTKLAMNSGKTAQYIQEVLGFKSAFQGRKLMDAARSKKEEWCANALQMCLKAVYSLNTTSGADDEEILTDLVLKLAL